MARRKLHRADVAELLGINPDSLGRAKLPERDGTDVEGSHARPYWWSTTIDAWLAARPGKGWRAGRPGPHPKTAAAGPEETSDPAAPTPRRKIKPAR